MNNCELLLDCGECMNGDGGSKESRADRKSLVVPTNELSEMISLLDSVLWCVLLVVVIFEVLRIRILGMEVLGQFGSIRVFGFSVVTDWISCMRA